RGVSARGRQDMALASQRHDDHGDGSAGSSISGDTGTTGSAARKPGTYGGRQGGDAGGQGGLEYRGVARRVVGRQVPYRGGHLGSGRDIGEQARVGAAEESVHARDAGRGGEEADILAAGDRPG